MKSKATILQGNKTKLIVVYNENDGQSPLFFQNLDKALQEFSAADRLEIISLNGMKDKGTIEDLKMPIPSMALYRSGKKIASTNVNTKVGQSKFLNRFRKDII